MFFSDRIIMISSSITPEINLQDFRDFYFQTEFQVVVTIRAVCSPSGEKNPTLNTWTVWPVVIGPSSDTWHVFSLLWFCFLFLRSWSPYPWWRVRTDVSTRTWRNHKPLCADGALRSCGQDKKKQHLTTLSFAHVSYNWSIRQNNSQLSVFLFIFSQSQKNVLQAWLKSIAEKRFYSSVPVER